MEENETIVAVETTRPFARVVARHVPKEELDRLGIEEGMKASHITSTPEIEGGF